MEFLRKDAKRLLRDARAGHPAALDRLRRALPRLARLDDPHAARQVKLADVHHAIARELGGLNWADLTRRGDPVDRLLVAVRGRALRDIADHLFDYAPLAASSLHAACALGSRAHVAAHLDREPASIDARHRGWTPLLYACASPINRLSARHSAGLYESVRVLLDRGADPNTVADRAADAPHPVDPPVPAITVATRSANMPVALLLQQHGANMRMAVPALLVQEPQRPWADVFKEHFARPEVRAQMRAHDEATRAAYGAACGQPDVRWMHEPRAPRGQSFAPEVWTALLDRGYDAAGCGEDGSTLLHRAVRTGQVDLLRLVLTRGVDPNVLDADGRPAIAIAIRSGELEAVAALRQAGADDSSVTTIDRFIGACVRADLAEARALAVANRRLVQRLKAADYEFFVRAAGAGDANQVSTLLAAGVNPNGLGEGGATPLHAAAWSARVDVVHLLLDDGARREHRDATYGETPLEWAIQGSSAGRHAPEDYAAVMATLRSGSEG